MMKKSIFVIITIIVFIIVGCGSTASKIKPEQRAEAIKLYERYLGSTGYVSGIVPVMNISPDDFKVPEISGQRGYEIGRLALLQVNLKNFGRVEDDLINEKVMPENERFKQQLLEVIKLKKEYVRADYYYTKAVLENDLSEKDIEKYCEVIYDCNKKAFEEEIKLMQHYHHDIAQDVRVVHIGRVEMKNGHKLNGVVGYSNGDISLGVISSGDYNKIGNLKAFGDYIVVACCVENNSLTDYHFNYNDFSLVDMEGNHQKVSVIVQEELERIATYEKFMKYPNKNVVLKKGKSQEYGLVFDIPEIEDSFDLWKYKVLHKLCYINPKTKEHFEVPLRAKKAMSDF